MEPIGSAGLQTGQRASRLAIIATLWALFAGMFFLSLHQHKNVWYRVFGVPVMAQPFADLAQIPAAVETVHHGLNPYAHNPFDIEHRPFIYPRAWIYLFEAARIGPQQTFAAGLAVAACFLATVSWLIWRQTDLWASAFLGLAAFSSAGAFAVERGNTDILILILLVLAVAWERRGGIWFLAAAAVLKIYPLAALLGEAAAGRRTRLLWAALLVSIIGLLAQHGDMVKGKTSNDVPHGYGVKEIDVAMEIAPARARAVFAAHRGAFRLTWQMALLAMAATGVASGARWGRSRELMPGGAVSSVQTSQIKSSQVQTSQAVHEFLLGACIFVGTFVAGTNYDYRLIFLVLLVPLLVSQARRAPYGTARGLAAAALLLILVGMNRGTAGLVHSPKLTPVLKASSHLDLWALLWIVSFFLGWIMMAGRAALAEDRKPALHDKLVREPA